jgi:hypothetical protein
MNLTELANKYGTDKGTVAGLGHGYSLLYDLLFSRYRLEPINLCEIGLCIGGPEVKTGSVERSADNLPSISMWHEYFPNAMLYGVDISDFSPFQNDWFKFVRADAGDAALLQKVVDLGVEFDIVIDDGSHAHFHQQRTFLSLFPTVKSGGLFIIEDLQWQPETYAGQLPRVPPTDALLNQLISGGRFSASGALPLSEWRALEGQIKNVFLIDEDWLYQHRRQYNQRHGLTPEQRTFHDSDGAGVLSPRFWRRLAGRLRAEFEGPNAAHRRPRTKIAIIEKA